ncbi:MAG: prepilin peptidase [Planctomycetes bacterium]|nr:prepilin peptidase [Planctomycetota bacterium]
MQLLADAILATVVVIAAVTDVRSGRVYNWLVYPAVVLGLLVALVTGGLPGLKDHALAAAIGFGVMFLCYAIGGMGGGDVKLMAAIGALGGLTRSSGALGSWHWPEQTWFVAYVMFYAFAIGAAMGITAAIQRRIIGRTVAATWWGIKVLTLPGTNVADAAPAKPSIRVPFGLATCLGTFWALAEGYAGGTAGSLVSRLIGL